MLRKIRGVLRPRGRNHAFFSWGSKTRGQNTSVLYWCVFCISDNVLMYKDNAINLINDENMVCRNEVRFSNNN